MKKGFLVGGGSESVGGKKKVVEVGRSEMTKKGLVWMEMTSLSFVSVRGTVWCVICCHAVLLCVGILQFSE